ncbi:MAG: amino-acid N-acetyltransferase [Treponemataceae bacterium]|nr:MAG: amino-acid N-acetyltransferase [Treponemataceae bacterium]
MTETAENFCAEHIRSVLRYIDKFKNSIFVMYIDGAIFESNIYSQIIGDICLMHQSGIQIVLVPGARAKIDKTLCENNIPWEMHEGIRVTSENTMPLIKMAAFDLPNAIMNMLARYKRTALIGNWVRARSYGVRGGIDYGSAGCIDKINTDALRTVLQNGFIPIFPCIGWSLSGKPYNISSMELAAEIAAQLQADKLFFISQSEIIPHEKPLAKKNAHCISALNIEQAQKLLVKMQAAKNKESIAHNKHFLDTFSLALNACKNGVERAHILAGEAQEGTLLQEIFSDSGSGLMIYKNEYGGIRKMRLYDIPSVHALMQPFVQDGLLLERTPEDLAQNYKDYIVFELDGGVRACAALHAYSDGQFEIAAVAVDKLFSELGTGPKMISFLVEKAKQFGAKSVFVLTSQTADWFESLDFTKTDIETLPSERKAVWDKKRTSKPYRITFE